MAGKCSSIITTVCISVVHGTNTTYKNIYANASQNIYDSLPKAVVFALYSNATFWPWLRQHEVTEGSTSLLHLFDVCGAFRMRILLNLCHSVVSQSPQLKETKTTHFPLLGKFEKRSFQLYEHSCVIVCAVNGCQTLLTGSRSIHK